MKITSYDIIGSREKAVAVIDVPDELMKEKTEIAEQIMKEHKNVKSVLRKVSERKGVFRTREYELLAGSKNTEVIHKESGCRFKLDPRKVYFSVREGTERLRIAEQTKPEETVMLMFGGIAVCGIIIAKKQPLVDKIISIEINPKAFEYMKENIRLNKVEDKIIPILGDVREKCKDWFGKCDRVIMPLPYEAWKFLDLALECLKGEGTTHLYFIAREGEAEKTVKKELKKFIKNPKYRIRKVLPYSPRTNKYCVDIKK